MPDREHVVTYKGGCWDGLTISLNYLPPEWDRAPVPLPPTSIHEDQNLDPVPIEWHHYQLVIYGYGPRSIWVDRERLGKVIQVPEPNPDYREEYVYEYRPG